VAGKTSRVAAGSVASNWSGTFGDLASFATGNLAGSITADSINSLNANTLTGAQIRLNRAFAPGATALNRLYVRGAMTNTDIRSDADLGTISAASISGSTIFAGKSNGGGKNLPTDATAFVNAATIRGVTVRGRGATPTFADTNIAASTLGRMNLGTVQVNNGGKAFGLAAQTIAAVSGQRNDTGETARAVRLTEPADSITAVDLQVRVF
jgi:hypothetical protein